MKNSLWSSLLVGAVLLAPAAAAAQYAPVPVVADPVSSSAGTGYQEHDGFYLRLTLGAGYGHMKNTYTGTDMAFKGPAGTLGLALGGAVSPNLIVYGELYGMGLNKPTFAVNGHESEMDGGVSAGGIGAGLAYYVQPINLYFSGTFLLESFTRKYNKTDTTLDSDSGVGGMLSVGKEWWVSDNWGLGVAAQFHMASIKEKDIDTRWTVTSFAIACSATFN
jgi:hypothetical protein